VLANRSMPASTVIPVLGYDDAGEAIEWLCEADYPYGERQYTAEDLGGHRWTFSQSIADVAPEEWGGLSDPAGRLPGP
jgi:hypothetical protein